MPAGSDWQTLGAVVAKTTTVHERLGNPRPRIAHSRAWTMNSIGLANPGIDAVLRDYAPKWPAWQVPVILSIAGESVDDFHALAAAVDGAPGVAGIEINVSCPNVAGGLDFAQSPQLTGDVVRAVVGATSLPVLAKLSPNVTDIVPIAQAAEAAGAHALTLTNTLIGMALDRDSGGSVLGTATGGVSGPALKPITLAMVYKTTGPSASPSSASAASSPRTTPSTTSTPARRRSRSAQRTSPTPAPPSRSWPALSAILCARGWRPSTPSPASRTATPLRPRGRRFRRSCLHSRSLCYSHMAFHKEW